MAFHKFCLVPYQIFLSSEHKGGEKKAVVINSVIRNFEIKYIDDQKLHTLY